MKEIVFAGLILTIGIIFEKNKNSIYSSIYSIYKNISKFYQLTDQNKKKEKNEDELAISFYEEKNIVDKKKLTIAIDFGNYESGFSYTFDNDINSIRFGKNQPTIITLTKNNHKKNNYGKTTFNSIIYYSEEEKNKVIYLNNLKLNLLKENKSEKKFTSFNNKAVIEYLSAFSEGALEEINQFRLEEEKYIKEEVDWIITAPGMWDEFRKLLLIDCARKSGLKNINLALESEAASLAYSTDDTIKKEKGEIFMSVDLGQYKVDISINELLEDGQSIKQLSSPLGKELGSMNINNDILKEINKIVFNDNIFILDYIKDINNAKILQEIENLKNSFSFCENEEVIININNLRMDKIYQASSEMKIVKYKNYSIKIDNRNIYLPSELINNIILKTVNELVDYIKNIIKENNKEFKISHILLSGGFSNNKILRSEFKKKIKNIKFFFLANEKYSVMRGAIIYQINPNLIQVRKHKYIYGFENFDRTNNRKFIVKINQKEMTSKNDIIQKNITSISPFQDTIYFKIFRTEDESFDSKQYIGTIFLNITKFKKYKIKIKLETVFHLTTYLKIYANERISNKTINGFLS